MRRITLALPAPYVGLRPFEERDALLFFGRDAHVRDLLRKFAQQRFTAVIGVSGSGKSSLVRAGLIPALHSGDLSRAGHRWNVFTFKPGNAPLANLAKELVRDERWVGATDGSAEHYLSHTLAVSPLTLTEMYRTAQERFAGEAVLLVVDQFEEIFRYRGGDQRRDPSDQGNIDEAEAFVKLLLRSAAEPEVPIYVLITMRTDFLGQCSVFYGLPEAINGGIYLTPRLDRDQITSVIASPLALVGGGIDGALVAHLINTLGDEDELPVLEHALLRMWQHARGNGRSHLDESDFEAMCRPPADPGLGQSGRGSNGRGRGSEVAALELCARQVTPLRSTTGSPRTQQRIARRLFLALSERREGQDVRRPQRLCDLLDQIGQENRDDVLAVIEAFRAEGVGFLMPPAREALSDGKVIDISHESLIRQWQYFRRWLREEEADVAELREWQHRAAQNRDAGGGWLDANDAARAGRWRARIEERGVSQGLAQPVFPLQPHRCRGRVRLHRRECPAPARGPGEPGTSRARGPGGRNQAPRGRGPVAARDGGEFGARASPRGTRQATRRGLCPDEPAGDARRDGEHRRRGLGSGLRDMALVGGTDHRTRPGQGTHLVASLSHRT